MASSSALAQVAAGVGLGGIGFIALAGAEIVTRLTQGGVKPLGGEALPSGISTVQVFVAVIIVLIAMTSAVLTNRWMRASGTLAAAIVMLAATGVGLVFFHESTFVSYAATPSTDLPRLLHAGSTSLGTFVALGLLIFATITRRSRLPQRSNPNAKSEVPT